MEDNEVIKPSKKKNRQDLDGSTVKSGEGEDYNVPKHRGDSFQIINEGLRKKKDSINFNDEELQSEQDEEKEQQLDLADDKTQFFAHGKYHTFSPKSVWLLAHGNPVRDGFVWVITHKRFDQVIVGLILVNSLLLGIKDYTDVNNESSINQFVEQCEPIFAWAFSIECVLKILGMGFILDPGSYLRDAWNWLDFIVVVSSLLTAIPQMTSVSGMRTFRLMRPLRSLTTMPSMKILISTLLASVAQLGGVLILAVFFFTVFAILGVSLWSGKIYERCRLTEFPIDGDWIADPEDTSLCSSERQCPLNRWCGSLAEASRSDDPRYFIDPSIDIKRDSSIEDLNFGYSSFNHLPSAFLTIFQCITLEGWIDITNIYTDAYQSWFVGLYFLLCIIICSFFVLNLTIAVMLLKYEDLDKSEKSSKHLQDLHEYGEQIGLPESFIEFIIEQDCIQISLKGLKILKNQKQESSWKQLIKSTAVFDHEDSYYQNNLTRVCFYIVNSPIFNGFIIFVILLNTVVLAMDKYPDYPPRTAQIFDVGNTIFTIIFTLEVVLKVTGLGVQGFSADKFNLFDSSIVIISLIEMFGNSTGSGGGAFSALRAFRLSRIFKIFRAGDLRTLLDGIAFTVLAVGDYTILLGLFVYVFALLGMSFFAGKVKFNEDGDWDLDGESPRGNFDHIGWAALTVFEIMIGENWNSAMYDHMRSVGSASCIYFIALVIFGNIIMLNLFLAILLGNFDRARNFGEKKKIFDAFDSLGKMGYNLNIAIQYLFDDADFSKYIEEKILQNKEEKTKEQLRREEEAKNQILYTEKELRQVYYSMVNQNIEAILQGDIQLDDQPWNSQEEIPEMHQEKTIEVMNFIKKQQILRIKRLEFQEQLKKTQEQREAMEKMQDQEEIFSTQSEAEEISRTPFERVIEHIQNSSLLIFHQNSQIRSYCQLCIQIEDDPEASSKQQKPNNEDESPKKEDSAKKHFQCNNPEKEKSSTFQVVPLGELGQLSKQQSQTITKSNLNISQKSIVKKKAQPQKNSPAKIFEGIIMTLIIISSITLVIDNPLSDPESTKIVTVSYIDNCFTLSFTIESLIKIIAMGFLFNNKILRDKGFTPYIRNPWNIVDFIVVMASIIDFVVTIKTQALTEDQQEEMAQSSVSSSLQSVKALRALRALRPLRMISRNQGMKLIVNALLSSLPSMTNVTIVCVLFILIFAIIGVNSFKGTFGSCNIEDEELLHEIFTYQDCLDRGGIWDNPKETFDNTLIGCRTLFEMMSTEGWIDIMNRGIDGISPDENGNPMQPQFNNSPAKIIYFVVFMVFGSQFILNLFVGVIMDNFNKIKEKEEWGSLFVTEDQKSWIDAQRLGLAKTLQKKIDPPEGWRGHFFKVVSHKIFEGLITFFIAFNTVVMASKYDGLDPVMETIFENLNYLFATIFNIEMIFKLLGLGSQYFYSGWNLFDMMVVIGTDIGIVLNLTTSGSSFSTAATVVRAFRIMRVVRLVRTQANIKIILDTLVNIIPQITNFIALMFLLLFIYAALGINLFSGIILQEYVTEKNNFKNISTAIIYLFRCSTGEDWNKIMHEMGLSSDGTCIDDQDYDVLKRNEFQTMGCGSPFAYAYFLSFTIIIAWLIMNLSVAAVIEGLENAKQQNSGLIAGDDVQQLIDAWMEYDPKATGWIDIIDFVQLMIELPPPFGNPELAKMYQYTPKKFVKAKNMIYNVNSFYVNEEKFIIIKNKDILKFLSIYKIQTYEGKTHRVHFKDIYQILIKRVFKEEYDDFDISKYLKTKMKNQWLEKHKKVKDLPKTGFKAHQSFSTSIIARIRMEVKAPKPHPSQYAQYANYQNVRPINNDDSKSNLGKPKKSKDSTVQIEEEVIDSGLLSGLKHGKSMQYSDKKSLNHKNKLKHAKTREDAILPPIINKARYKNRDENPQEFEEIEDQIQEEKFPFSPEVQQVEANDNHSDPGVKVGESMSRDSVKSLKDSEQQESKKFYPIKKRVSSMAQEEDETVIIIPQKNNAQEKKKNKIQPVNNFFADANES